jgi:hypothetical protein
VVDVEGLLSLARSDVWSDRARAGRELAGFVGLERVDGVVRSLLLDPRDTAVTEATAEALLLRADVTALRLFAVAWAVADDRHRDHLYGVLSGRLFDLSCGSSADRDRFRTVWRELLVDADAVVCRGTQDLLPRLAHALPD